MNRILEFGACGARPARWFSLVDVAAPGLDARYRWSARLLWWAGAASGTALPWPTHVSVEDPTPILRWMLEVLRARRSPNLFAFASPAVRLCQAALKAGVDLSGARVMLTGEPVTERRLALVRQTGATAEPHDGSIECGPLGYGCEQAAAVDEVHVPHDLCAILQPGPGEGPPGASRDTLFVSSVRPTAPWSCSTSPWATRRCGRSARAAARWSSSAGAPISTRSGATRSSPPPG